MKILAYIKSLLKKKRVKEVPKSKILIDIPDKGQFLWQFNMRTKELKKREDYTTTLTGVKKLEREPDCIYAVAINKENAAKKIIKLLDKLEKL